LLQTCIRDLVSPKFVPNAAGVRCGTARSCDGDGPYYKTKGDTATSTGQDPEFYQTGNPPTAAERPLTRCSAYSALKQKSSLNTQASSAWTRSKGRRHTVEMKFNDSGGDSR